MRIRTSSLSPLDFQSTSCRPPFPIRTTPDKEGFIISTNVVLYFPPFFKKLPKENRKLLSFPSSHYPRPHFEKTFSILGIFSHPIVRNFLLAIFLFRTVSVVRRERLFKEGKEKKKKKEKERPRSGRLERDAVKVKLLLERSDNVGEE